MSSEVLCEGLEILIVFLSNIGDGNAGSSLSVNELSESCLSLDESIGDSLLSAESGEESHEFDGVDIMSNNNELSFTFFNELGNVVKTEFQNVWLGTLFGITTGFLGFSFLKKSGLLVFLGLWLVFCK